MIRTEAEYKQSVANCLEQAQRIQAERERLKAEGLKKREIERALEPLQSFHAQLRDEIEDYERLRRGELDEEAELQNLAGMGVLLIRLRIAAGLTQAELAKRLDCDASQVSRDERNEYRGITMDRASKILDSLGVDIASRVRSIEPRRVVVE